MSNKFFLGGLAKKTTTQDIQSFFGKYGEIEDAIVMVQNGESRGFGFVTFRDGPRAISQGILANDNIIHERRIDVKSTIPESDIEANVRTKSIRVTNINPSTPDSTLMAHFSKFGAVSSINREGPSSVIVDFASEDQCENAFRAQAHDIDGVIVKVDKHGGVIVKGRKRPAPEGRGRGGGRGGPMRDQGGRNDVHPYQKQSSYPQDSYRYEQAPPVQYPSYGYSAGGYDYNSPYQPYGTPYQQYGAPDPYQPYGGGYGAPAPATYGAPVPQQPSYGYGASQGSPPPQNYGARSSGETDNADPRCKIFVGGLTDQTNGGSLKAYFQKFGEVVSAEVKMQGGKSRKFGFVVFANPGSVSAAAQVHYHQVDGKQVEVKPSDGGNRRS